MQFLPRKILQVAVRMSDVRNLFCEIIFYTRRAFKNVGGILIMSYCDWFLLKKLRDKLQLGVSHAATWRVALRKVEAASTFSATCNAIFVARLVANMGCHTRKSSLQLAMQRHCVARKIASCDMAFTAALLLLSFCGFFCFLYCAACCPNTIILIPWVMV